MYIPVATTCIAREEGTVVSYASWDLAPVMDGECPATCWENLDLTVSCMEGEGPAPTVQAPMPACESEDIEGAPDCYWDASVQGNGLGQSFVWQDGFIIYMDEPAPAPEATTESTLTPATPMPDTLAITGPDDVSPVTVLVGAILLLAGVSLTAYRRWAR